MLWAPAKLAGRHSISLCVPLRGAGKSSCEGCGFSCGTWLSPNVHGDTGWLCFPDSTASTNPWVALCECPVAADGSASDSRSFCLGSGGQRSEVRVSRAICSLMAPRRCLLCPLPTPSCPRSPRLVPAGPPSSPPFASSSFCVPLCADFSPLVRTPVFGRGPASSRYDLIFT